MALLAFAPAYLVPMIANLLGIYALTRILTPDQYGDYAFVMSIMALFQSGLLDWALLGAKRFFERTTQSNQLPAMCVTIYLGLGISAVTVFAICAAGLQLFDVPSEMASLLWIGAAVVVAKEISMVSKGLELAAMSRTRYIMMECGESLVAVALGLWLCWYLRLGAGGILYGMLVGALLVVMFDARRIVHRLRGGTFDIGLQKQILAFAAPISLAFFVEYVMSSADRMLLQFYLGAHQLGIYAVAYNIADRAVTAVFLAISVAAYPLIVQALERGGPAAARHQARQNVDVLMAIAIPAWGGFTMASNHIATILAGPAFAASVAELLPLAGVAVFICSLRVHYFSYAQQLTHRTWTLMVATVPGALVNVGLNIVLLPTMGLKGAIWARLVGYVVALVISIWLGQRQLRLPFPGWSVAKVSLATLAMCVLLHMLAFRTNTLGLVGMILVGALFYGVIALAFDLGGLRNMWYLRRSLRPLPT
ncbi:MAG TPA: oligosaccharide flippase family protein [Acetobacteraceae bacterium]|nr:oligosaccharide flippase family protein [Acetobacteraceae bacterium]